MAYETTESKPTEEVKPTSTPSLTEKKKKEEEEVMKCPPPPVVVKKNGSFREESNAVGDLQEYQKKALDELKSLLRSSALLDTNRFSSPAPPPAPESPTKPQQQQQQQKKEEEEGVSTPAVEEEEEENPNAADDDGDGAKTVEAIESTVVPVAASPPPSSPHPPKEEEEEEKVNAMISIWGVPLLEDSKRRDTVLLKFLSAREFKAKDAMAMINHTILWRRDYFGTTIDDHHQQQQQEEEEEEEEDIPEFHKVVFMDGVDKEGHPVCYNVYGEFHQNNKEAFGANEEKRKRFLRWRIHFLEKGIRELLMDIGSGSGSGVSTMVQVIDFKNSSGALLKPDLRHALSLMLDNYPEFVAKQIFINVPWWYLAFNKMISPFLTQRTKSKFVFAGPSKSAHTLFNYIAPEQVPVQFGGLSNRKDAEFTTNDAVHEIDAKPSAKQIIEIPVAEKCLLAWELRVVGWEVALGAEFVPSSEDGYTVIIEKKKKILASSDDHVVLKNSFKVSEPGKVLLTVDNTTSKKKKILYRCKATCSSN